MWKAGENRQEVGEEGWKQKRMVEREGKNTRGLKRRREHQKRGNSTGESEMKVNENIGRVKGIVQGGAEREVERRSRERIGDQIEGDNIENEGE